MVMCLGTVAFALSTSVDASGFFNRISTFNVCEMDNNCLSDNETSAKSLETFTMENGRDYVVYTDSPKNQLGFVDISDPSNPKGLFKFDLPGEPTSAKVVDNKFVVVAVNTSEGFYESSGSLIVYDVRRKYIVKEIPLSGIPDTMDISSIEGDGPFYIAIAIAIALEDEDEVTIADGSLDIVTIPSAADVEDPNSWTFTNFELPRFPEGPVPKYVAISKEKPNEVVVTIQESNYIARVDMSILAILDYFGAGTVTLTDVDNTEEENLILQIETMKDVRREPDGVTWIGSTTLIATANEGEYGGGSRGFTIFDTADRSVVYDSGNTLEWISARVGHYPDRRSNDKGSEPDNTAYGEFHGTPMLFVALKRASLIVVYDVTNPASPVFVQVLPAGIAPKSIAVYEEKNLLLVASEVDSREGKVRASIGIYEFFPGLASPQYPTLVSDSRDNGAPIPFSALSGLAADPTNPNYLFTVEDSFYKWSRILMIDAGAYPAVVEMEMRVKDTNGVLSKALSTATGDNIDNVEVDLAEFINENETVNLDLEGIAVRAKGGFWLVSEGVGTVGDVDRPVECPNLLICVSPRAKIEMVLTLPSDYPDQFRFGLEGVAEDGDRVVMVVQRAWGEEDHPRIVVYCTITKTWKHAFYPLDEPSSPDGGWVGLGDISAIPNKPGMFLVIERDNKAGPDATIKKITSISLGDYTFEDGVVLEKVDLPLDLIDTYTNKMAGNVLEKVEGLAVTADGAIFVVNDNDGVDDNSGEQQLLKFYERQPKRPTLQSLDKGLDRIALNRVAFPWLFYAVFDGLCFGSLPLSIFVLHRIRLSRL